MITDTDIPGVLRLRMPMGTAVPLVFDSPHSGDLYPDDFGAVAQPAELRRAEDAFIDDLYGAAPDQGAPLLAALFPRLYIDPNRAEADMDPAQLDGDWDGPGLAPGEKAKLGQGVVWTRRPPGLPLYPGKFPVAALRHRVETYHRPYHRVLSQVLDEWMGRFGGYYHIDCHSMPSAANAMSPDPAGTLRPDFIIGSRDDTTCAPELTERVRAFLAGRGYDVWVNRLYKGVEIVNRYGDPASGRHSLQIEINRRLYMDEDKIVRGAHFDGVKTVIGELIADLRQFAEESPPGPK